MKIRKVSADLLDAHSSAQPAALSPRAQNRALAEVWRRSPDFHWRLRHCQVIPVWRANATALAPLAQDHSMAEIGSPLVAGCHALGW